MAEAAALVKHDEQVLKDIATTEAQYERNKDAVIDMLMKHITNIDLSVPKVVIGDFENTL